MQMVELYSSVDGTWSSLVHTKSSPRLLLFIPFYAYFPNSSFLPFTEGNPSRVFCIYLFVICILEKCVLFCVYVFFIQRELLCDFSSFCLFGFLPLSSPF